MLSYQHEYHAGNFADVHKHLCLRILFQSLLKKDKPFCYVDCHAGAGSYDLDSAQARRTGEFGGGIGKLWNHVQNADSPALTAYLQAVAVHNQDRELRHYPGSPALARQWLRTQDKALLFELHPQSQRALKKNIGADPRFSVHARDCYEGLVALVPPPVRRGLVLLDPSYEIKDEYRRIAALTAGAHRRWANAIYAIWYPLLSASRHLELLAALERSGLGDILLSELTVAGQAEDGGMYGSGMAFVNPPWRMDEELGEVMPPVAQIIAPGTAKASVRWLGAGPAAGS
jgi:23S rRNA (adenine2030-N6)-methyltransferase